MQVIENPPITVIVPCYNAEDRIETSLNSICNNTYENIEIICVNDGSTDRTQEICEKYAATDKRFKVINQENGGVAAARNAGIEAATGELITFVDSDDYISRQYFDILLYFHKRYPDMTVGPKYQVIDDGTSIDLNQTVNDFSKLKAHICWLTDKCRERYMVNGRLYSRKDIGSLRFIQGLPTAEDNIFNYQIMAQHGRKMLLVDEPLYYYVQVASSITHKIAYKDILPGLQEMIKVAQKEQESLIRHDYYINILKQIFYIDYYSRFDLEYTDIKRRCLELKHACFSDIRQDSCFSRKEYVFYRLMAWPFIYHLFRILDDPTLRTWEKEQRKNQKMISTLRN